MLTVRLADSLPAVCDVMYLCNTRTLQSPPPSTFHILYIDPFELHTGDNFGTKEFGAVNYFNNYIVFVLFCFFKI